MQSLSEIDTTSKRASKAAGFSWGISEEIGKAIRNLELFGFPGIKNLNLYLNKIEQKHPEKISSLVDNIIQNQMNNGQFDNAYITLKEIGLIKKIFNKKLQNIHHSRIEYPSS